MHNRPDSDGSPLPSATDLFAGSTEAILVHDPEDGAVLDANPTAERLYGYDAAELRGRQVSELLAGEGLTEMERRDLGEVLDDAAERARSMSDAATVNNHVSDVEVVADELLEDVFSNLFLNAVEHGSTDSRTRSDDAVEHGVTIDVTAAVEDVSVTIRIADDGPGIEPDRRRRVFDRGEKGTGPSGTGFGLYFVDSMVESYGGRIWIEDSDSGGAAFVIELPRTE